MKKNAWVLFSLIATLCLSQAAHAVGYGMAGCGLGALVFEDKPGMIQIVAATLNATSASQTFGMTTGTSNCVESRVETASLYISINEVALQKDISRGTGETISGLSKIYQCEDATVLGTKLQENYAEIYNTSGADSKVLGEKIQKTIRGDAFLNRSCKSLS